MKLLVLTALLAACESSVVPLGIAPHSHPITSLYHSQDVHGQYAYGYATPTSSKAETKTADGVTSGGYSYIDSNGILQTVQYLADPVHGFRVAATNLPQDLPEVAHAKAKHLADFAQIANAQHHPEVVQDLPEVAHAKAKHLAHFAQIANAHHQPEVVQDLPEVAAARARHLQALEAAYNGVNPVQDLPEVAHARAQHLEIVAKTRARDAAAHLSPISLNGNVVAIQTALPAAHAQVPAQYHAQVPSQYHAQDGLGLYSYGYVGPWSSKSETKTADGVTRGGYSYIDANGVLQTVNYISDPVNGFRVAATNLPAAPVQKQAAVKTPGLYVQDIYY